MNNHQTTFYTLQFGPVKLLIIRFHEHPKANLRSKDKKQRGNWLTSMIFLMRDFSHSIKRQNTGQKCF